MKMIAQHTIGTGRMVREATSEEKKAGKRDEYETVSHAPGAVFDVDDTTARDLIRSGAARKWQKPEEDEGPTPVAAVRSPPASGSTREPDPNAVADRAMAGELLDQFREEDESAKGKPASHKPADKK